MDGVELLIANKQTNKKSTGLYKKMIYCSTMNFSKICDDGLQMNELLPLPSTNGASLAL